MKNNVAVPLALMALLAAGCQRGGAASPTGTTNTGNSTPASAAPAPKNLVTPETAGKPVLNLKLGEPVAFRKGGITLTLIAKSFEKLDGDPPDQTDFLKKESCGVWWKLSEEIVVDAEPNATWSNWAVDSLGGFIGFQRGTGGEGFAHIPVTDPGTGPDRIINVTVPAEAERRAHPDTPFHKTLESKEYYGMCGTDHDGELTGQPSGLEPLGVDAKIGNIPEGTLKPTTIARWLR
ncbi:MAG: hypothetical protein ACRC20_06325 [Segniliparus sp.]|uniref:hypothetical protein n=1 Tax=Segniliparus sp. TaxID=2804064 RepID=UPI003F32BB63